jgi:hypothetical protein
VVATGDEKYYEGVLLEPHQWLQGDYTACSSAQAPLSTDSGTASDDDDDDQDQSGSDPQTQWPTKSQCTLPPHLQKSALHTFMGGPRGKKDSEASHISDGSTPLSVCMLYFAEVVTLTVVETNWYHH